jgi:hypothetical protein
MNYAAILRAIGQDLHRRGLKAFDLRVEDELYVADCGYQEPPAQTPVNLHYSRSDLEKMDSQEKARRGKAPAANDFWKPDQALRTVGGYLDKNKACLRRVTNNHIEGEECCYRVESLNAEGETVVDVWSQAALYDLCVTLYKRRGRSTGTGGRWQ